MNATGRFKGISSGWGILLGAPALFAAAYAYTKLPAGLHIRLCAVRRFTGIECPGCGLRSSISSLVHGHIRESIDLHPLGVIVAGWVAYVFFRELAALIMGRRPRALLRQWQRDLLLYAFLVALIVQWVAKLVIT